MKKVQPVLIVLLLGVLLTLAACGGNNAATPAATEAPAEETAVPEPTTETTADAPTSPTATPLVANDQLISNIGLNPSQIALNTQGLPYPWQANAVPGTPYDASQPPGPVGVPDHIQINFGTMDPAGRQPEDPVMFIIPVDAYKNLWDAVGNNAVSTTVDQIYQNTVALTFPPPYSEMPALPFEMVPGVNDFAVQIGRTMPNDISASKSGYRFLGRYAQDANPVLDGDLRYIYQGFTNDGKYLVSFFYPPISNSSLPTTASAEEVSAVQTDMAGYLQGKAAELNAQPTSSWNPDLATLDALVASLTIVGMPGSGIEGNLWQLVARSDGTTEEPLGDTESYTIAYFNNGQFSFQADCNQGQGVYAVSGGMVGTIGMELGPITLAECGAGSYSTEMVQTLQAAQDFKIRPGGNVLELVKPAGGGSLLFRNVGPADAAPPDSGDSGVDLPDPGAGQAYGRVTAPDGIFIRTGPGTSFDTIGTAPFGEEGPIIGKSADGQWWAVEVPGAENNTGWVSAAFVEAFNVENVPVIQPPTAPVPTATPTATPPPQAEISFTADRTAITSGECANLSWRVANVQGVWVYPLGQPYDQFPVTGEGTQSVCPTVTTTYEMRVLKQDGALELRQVTISVTTNNPLANTNWAVASLNGGQAIGGGVALTLSFANDGTMGGFGGCNSFSGNYTINGISLALSISTQTGALCGEEIDQQETAYLSNLTSAVSFEQAGTQLIIRGAAGEELVRLNRAG
jgi:heat shock protein HslJ/uncharacterized protein YraI